MKVGVITFHSANNYGAVLQTWALQKVLSDYGLDTGVIHYHPDIIDGLYDPMNLKRGMRRQFKKLKLLIKSRNSLIRYNKFQAFIRNRFNLIGNFRTYDELKKAGLNLDAYIVGSDQVWNTDHTGGFDPAYFLNFAEPGKKKIAYAASIGKDYVIPKFKEEYQSSLNSFTGISVREKSVLPAIQELTTNPVVVTLDPTMLLQKEDYEAIKVDSTIKEPYILVYMIEKNKQVIELANKLSTSLGIPIVQRKFIPGFKNSLDSFYTADAGEFLGLIEAAEYVITNSFHGTVFSILYEKPFVSMLHTDTGSRTADLLTELGLQSHILNDCKDFSDMKLFQITHKKRLRMKIDKLRQSSTEFLQKSLDLTDKYDKVQCPTNIRKDKCYGCSACKHVCKSKAIHLEEDREGFLYPIVDESLCVQCGMCKKVCIRKHDKAIDYAEDFPKVYCAVHKEDDIRKQSSSGGIFPALVRYAIEDRKGVVVGVRYDNEMRVVSEIADTVEGCKAFSGSKYVKSNFNDNFPKIKKLLKNDRFVLYTGLPCEAAGLRAYLRKDYDNLLICELLCHAAPSPKVFGKYIEYLNKEYQSKVIDLVFRSKEKGWKHGDRNVMIKLDNGKKVFEKTAENQYYRAFIGDFISRPSCNNCKYTYDYRVGDITIGDCWGIKKAAPELSDNKGNSLVLINNQKGDQIWNILGEHFNFAKSDLKTAFYKNHKKPTQDKRRRTAFFNRLDEEPLENLLSEYNLSDKSCKSSRYDILLK